jgi:cytochrome c
MAVACGWISGRESMGSAMFRIIFLLAVSLQLALSVVRPAWAIEYGTRDEAKAMTERVAQFFKDNGKDKTFTAVTEGSEGFKARDLYAFVYDNSGTCVAHGANKGLVGQNLLNLKDIEGKAVIKEIVAVQNTGWVDFKWQNPQTRAIEQKHAYVVRVNDYVFGVGTYDR